MTLDEAILHCEEVASQCDSHKCADDHRQLAEWLRELKERRRVTDDCISRQVAVDAIRASTKKYTGFMEMEMYTDDDAVEAIEGLPSVQPELPEWAQEVERMYNKALTKPYIKKPLAWALYQVLKEYDS